MDVSYLKSNVDTLLNHMRSIGYSISYIKICRSLSNHVIRNSSELSWASYDDVRDWVSLNEDFCERYRKALQFTITIIERFDVLHELPIHPVDDHQMTFCSHSAGLLDLLPMQERMAEFENAMIEKGFGRQYIKKIKQFAAKIIVKARTIPWDTFDEIRDYYRNSNLAAGTIQNHLLAINKMEIFLLRGNVYCHRNAPHCIEDATPSMGALNLLELKDRLPELQQYMKDNQYSASYIRRVILKAERIIVLSGIVPWDTYQDILDWHQNQGYNKVFMKELRTIVGIMSALHLYNSFPNNHETQHPMWPRENRYQKLIPEYREIVDYGCKTQKNRGLKDSSINRGKAEATSFLYFLQINGILSLKEVSEDDIINFSQSSPANSGRTVLHGLSRFMRDCIPLNPLLFRKINEYIPVLHQTRRTIQYLTAEECDAFQSALEDMDNNLTLKQRAIGTILFYTGMRASDVANLRVESVDLNKGLLLFTQMKTGIPVKLPLLPIVGNAIYDYCSMERPLSDSSFLFLGQNAPFHSMTSKAIGYITGKIMDKANIRMALGDRRGSHLFRHRVATTMAENNIPVPVISATLGQTSPQALDSYLSADITHLRECAIDLGKYVIPKEVFDSVGIQ